MRSPLAVVKEKFESKEKLIDAVKAFAGNEDLWLKRTSEDRGKDRGLGHVSNAKLLRLHAVFTEVKAKFGSRAAMIAELLKLQNRDKDEGMKKRLEAYPVPRLYDLYKSQAKRAKASSGEKAPPKAKAEAKPAKAEAPKAAKKAAPKRDAKAESMAKKASKK